MWWTDEHMIFDLFHQTWSQQLLFTIRLRLGELCKHGPCELQTEGASWCQPPFKVVSNYQVIKIEHQVYFQLICGCCATHSFRNYHYPLYPCNKTNKFSIAHLRFKAGDRSINIMQKTSLWYTLKLLTIIKSVELWAWYVWIRSLTIKPTSVPTGWCNDWQGYT